MGLGHGTGTLRVNGDGTEEYGLGRVASCSQHVMFNSYDKPKCVQPTIGTWNTAAI